MLFILGGIPNNKYKNHAKGFESYFLQFSSGARLELMIMPSIPDHKIDTVRHQHRGIIHLAFEVQSMEDVDAKAAHLKDGWFSILSGPHITGDGYYECETLDPENNRLEATCRLKD